MPDDSPPVFRSKSASFRPRSSLLSNLGLGTRVSSTSSSPQVIPIAIAEDETLKVKPRLQSPSSSSGSISPIYPRIYASLPPPTTIVTKKPVSSSSTSSPSLVLPDPGGGSPSLFRKNSLLSEMDNVNMMMEGQGKVYVAILGAYSLHDGESYVCELCYEELVYSTTMKEGPAFSLKEEFCFLVDQNESPIKIRLFAVKRTKPKKNDPVKELVCEYVVNVAGLFERETIQETISVSPSALSISKTIIPPEEKNTHFPPESPVLLFGKGEGGRGPNRRTPFSLLRKMSLFHEFSALNSVEESHVREGGVLQFMYTYEGDSLEVYGSLEKLLVSQDFDLLFAMISSVPLEDCVWLSTPVIAILAQNGMIMNFFDAALKKEIESTPSVGLLMRGQNLTIKILSVFMNIAGKDYLTNLLQSYFKKISLDWDLIDFEIDPEKCSAEQNPMDGLAYLLKCAKLLLCMIFNSVNEVPAVICVICRMLRRYVCSAFGEDAAYAVLSGVFFLRYVIPAIVSPAPTHLQGVDVGKKERRLLILIGKVIQNVASLVEFGEKERFMVPCNVFIGENIPMMKNFYSEISKKRSKKGVNVPRLPVHWRTFHLVHVAVSKFEVQGKLESQGKEEAKAQLETILDEIGKPDDQKVVDSLGYVDLEKIVEKICRPETGIIKFNLDKGKSKTNGNSKLTFISLDLIDWLMINISIPFCETRSDAVTIGSLLFSFNFISPLQPHVQDFLDGTWDVFEVVSTSFTSCREKILNGKKKLTPRNSGSVGLGGSTRKLGSSLEERRSHPANGMGGGEQGDDERALFLARELLEAEIDIYLKQSELVNHLIQEGMLTNIRNFPRFKVFTLSTCNLQLVDLYALDTNEQKASFWLNAYHTLMLHAYTESGAPTTPQALRQLLSSYCYNVGGYVFSLNDIEYGILRMHLCPPKVGKQVKLITGGVTCFDKKDERCSFALSKSPGSPWFPLLNFALNFGCTSSPTLGIYSSGTLVSDLETATKRYLSSHICVEKSESKTLVVKVSKILGWYSSDFGKDKKGMLRYLLPYFPPEMAHLEELRKWLGEAGVGEGKGRKLRVKVEQESFDWRYRCDLSQIKSEFLECEMGEGEGEGEDVASFLCG